MWDFLSGPMGNLNLHDVSSRPKKNKDKQTSVDKLSYQMKVSSTTVVGGVESVDVLFHIHQGRGENESLFVCVWEGEVR